MLGKGKRISPPQWGFFPIYVGHIPHACGEPPPIGMGKVGNSSLLNWYTAPLFKQFGVVALALFCQRGNFAIFSLIL